MATDGQELIAAALASVESRVQQQIEQARQRREREKQQRAERLAARTRGLASRHSQKLRNLARSGEVADQRVIPGSKNSPVRTDQRTPINSPTAQGDQPQTNAAAAGGDRLLGSRAQAGAHAQGVDHV